MKNDPGRADSPAGGGGARLRIGRWLRAGALAAVVLGAAALPAVAQDTEREMVEAVIETFPREGRQVYVAPALTLSDEMVQSGFQVKVRHSAKTLERVRQRFRAKTLYLEEAMHCSVPNKPETCILPGDGILFHFDMPKPLQNGILPVRVHVFISRGKEGKGIVRETWDFTLTRKPRLGWTVLTKQLVSST